MKETIFPKTSCFLRRVLTLGLFLSSICLLSSAVQASEIKVLAEVSPPFINGNKTGYSIDLLNRISRKIGYDFKVELVGSYERAWRSVAAGHADMVLHIAIGREGGEFRNRMLESAWFFPIQPTLFYKEDEKYQSFIAFIEGEEQSDIRIAHPMGNQHYWEKNLKLPPFKAFMAPMNSLVKQLANDRIDLIWCMKLNVEKALREEKIENVQSTVFPTNTVIKIGAGYKNSDKGRVLKLTIDNAVKELDLQKLYPEIFDIVIEE